MADRPRSDRSESDETDEPESVDLDSDSDLSDSDPESSLMERPGPSRKPNRNEKSHHKGATPPNAKSTLPGNTEFNDSNFYRRLRDRQQGTRDSGYDTKFDDYGQGPSRAGRQASAPTFNEQDSGYYGSRHGPNSYEHRTYPYWAQQPQSAYETQLAAASSYANPVAYGGLQVQKAPGLGRVTGTGGYQMEPHGPPGPYATAGPSGSHAPYGPGDPSTARFNNQGPPSSVAAQSSPPPDPQPFSSAFQPSHHDAQPSDLGKQGIHDSVIAAMHKADAVWNDSSVRDVSLHLELDVEDDVESNLGEFIRCRRLGDYKRAEKYFQDNLSTVSEQPKVLAEYVHMLVEQGAYKRIADLGIDELDLVRICSGRWQTLFRTEALRLLLLLHLTRSQSDPDLSATYEAAQIALNFLRFRLSQDMEGDGRALDHAEIQVLYLYSSLVQLMGFETPHLMGFYTPHQEQALWSRNLSHVYQKLLQEAKHCDIRDFLISSMQMLGMEKGLVSILPQASPVDALAKFLSDWTTMPEDELSYMALLDILNYLRGGRELAIPAQPSSVLETSNVEELASEQARIVATSIRDHHPKLMKSRSYLEWVLLEERLTRERSDSNRTEDKDETTQPRYLTTQSLKTFPGKVLTTGNYGIVYVPVDAENPGWPVPVSEKEAPQPSGPSLVPILLKTAQELGNYTIQSQCLNELICCSKDPDKYFTALEHLDSSERGSLLLTLQLRLMKYLAANDENSRKSLKSQLLELDPQLHIWRNFSHSVWNWAYRRVLYALMSSLGEAGTEQATAVHNQAQDLVPFLPQWVNDKEGPPAVPVNHGIIPPSQPYEIPHQPYGIPPQPYANPNKLYFNPYQPSPPSHMWNHNPPPPPSTASPIIRPRSRERRRDSSSQTARRERRSGSRVRRRPSPPSGDFGEGGEYSDDSRERQNQSRRTSSNRRRESKPDPEREVAIKELLQQHERELKLQTENLRLQHERELKSQAAQTREEYEKGIKQHALKLSKEHEQQAAEIREEHEKRAAKIREEYEQEMKAQVIEMKREHEEELKRRAAELQRKELEREAERTVLQKHIEEEARRKAIKDEEDHARQKKLEEELRARIAAEVREKLEKENQLRMAEQGARMIVETRALAREQFEAERAAEEAARLAKWQAERDVKMREAEIYAQAEASVKRKLVAELDSRDPGKRLQAMLGISDTEEEEEEEDGGRGGDSDDTESEFDTGGPGRRFRARRRIPDSEDSSDYSGKMIDEVSYHSDDSVVSSLRDLGLGRRQERRREYLSSSSGSGREATRRAGPSNQLIVQEERHGLPSVWDFQVGVSDASEKEDCLNEQGEDESVVETEEDSGQRDESSVSDSEEEELILRIEEGVDQADKKAVDSSSGEEQRSEQDEKSVVTETSEGDKQGGDEIDVETKEEEDKDETVVERKDDAEQEEKEGTNEIEAEIRREDEVAEKKDKGKQKKEEIVIETDEEAEREGKKGISKKGKEKDSSDSAKEEAQEELNDDNQEYEVAYESAEEFQEKGDEELQIELEEGQSGDFDDIYD